VTPANDSQRPGLFNRREAIAAAGVLGAGAGAWALLRGGGSRPAPRLATTPAASVGSPPAAGAARMCVLSPEVTEGPYYIASHLTRRNITEGLPGLPLALRITVVDAGTCKPIRGADVEVWHANASGVYSGFGGGGPPSGGGPDNAKRFLRGHQRSDARGGVLFDTIYPGWYPGRSPHIHVKAHVGGRVVHTGQIFFSDATSDAIYRSGAYRPHGQPDTTNQDDGIFRQAGGARARAHLTRRRGAGGYTGRIVLGLRA